MDENNSERRYYSVRTGKNPEGAQLSLPTLSRLFLSVYNDLERKGYFQEAFGYVCIDAGDIAGTIGYDREAFFLRKLRKDNLWPINDKCLQYSEDDLFDVIELLHDNVSYPTNGQLHSWGNCGWHYNQFSKQPGKIEYRKHINNILRDYGIGYEISQSGEILTLATPGTELIFRTELPDYKRDKLKDKIDAAIHKFRRSRATVEDKKDSIKTLVECLEFLRPQMKGVITNKDEDDLFNIANNFGIRHHNEKQKTEYDQSIWLNWMFYYYLATIHALTRLLKQKEDSQ